MPPKREPSNVPGNSSIIKLEESSSVSEQNQLSHSAGGRIHVNFTAVTFEVADTTALSADNEQDFTPADTHDDIYEKSDEEHEHGSHRIRPVTSSHRVNQAVTLQSSPAPPSFQPRVQPTRDAQASDLSASAFTAAVMNQDDVPIYGSFSGNDEKKIVGDFFTKVGRTKAKLLLCGHCSPQSYAPVSDDPEMVKAAQILMRMKSDNTPEWKTGDEVGYDPGGLPPVGAAKGHHIELFGSSSLSSVPESNDEDHAPSVHRDSSSVFAFVNAANSATPTPSSPVGRPHKCTQCNESYLRRDHLKRHVQTVHDKLRPFQCAYPNGKSKPFARKDNLAAHVRDVHEKGDNEEGNEGSVDDEDEDEEGY